MEQFTNTELSRMLHDKGIDTCSDMRPIKDIARQFGLLPVESTVQLDLTIQSDVTNATMRNTGTKDSPYFVR